MTSIFFSPLSFVLLFLDPGSEIRDPGRVKIRIRDKHPWSATLPATVMSCIDPSVRTVKKPPTVRPLLLIFSISLESAACLGSAAIVEDQLGLLVEERGLGRHEPVHHRKLSMKKNLCGNPAIFVRKYGDNLVVLNARQQNQDHDGIS